MPPPPGDSMRCWWKSETGRGLPAKKTWFSRLPLLRANVRREALCIISTGTAKTKRQGRQWEGKETLELRPSPLNSQPCRRPTVNLVGSWGSSAEGPRWLYPR